MVHRWSIRNTTNGAKGVRQYDVRGPITTNQPTNQPTTTPSSALHFQFTRHATSCYNIETFERIGPLRDGIPSLAHSGIVSTAALARAYQSTPRFQASTVCVSNLIRTWMTATLLYGLSQPTLTLRMCPHLRETGLVGNGAASLAASLPKFIAFLEQLRTFPDYQSLREIIILLPTRSSNATVWVELVIALPTDQTTPVPVDPLFCTIVDPLEVFKKGFTDVGDISTFMKWFRTAFPDQQGLVHVVAHSGIMKQYVERICKGFTYQGAPFDSKTYRVKGEPIDAQNCWSFTTPYEHANPLALVGSIQPGYLNPGKGPQLKDAQKEEQALGQNSLCLQQVEPIRCPKKGGHSQARRTTRNKQNKKNRRRTRRS